MKKFVGIDSGSTMCKSVLFDCEEILDLHLTKTLWNPNLSASECLDLLLSRNDLSRDDVIITLTGYGREAVVDANERFTEITCHAIGGSFLVPSIQGIIDIGGQDSKVINIQNGKVKNFLMNDKCAAGTGRFLSMSCETLGIPIDNIDEFVAVDDPVSINSMCAVFAESEIIGLLSEQVDRRRILSGIIRSIANRIYQMSVRVEINGSMPILLTGGLARSNLIAQVLESVVGNTVITHMHSQFAGAIGACICAHKKEKVKLKV